MIIETIEKKKRKEELDRQEITEIIEQYVQGKIPDYQMSALLMAIWFQGMSMTEITALTTAMMNSGSILDLSDVGGIPCDKHSSGGVGDKTTIVLAPLVAACGGIMAKMSGRGLGHTGGTIDKLESIPGFRTEMTPESFKAQVRKIGVALIGQSSDFVIADQMLYALRDVTGTVDSLPLIASSIMSKKLAAGSQAILLDVKYGNGAFMKTKEEAKALADCMCTIGDAFHKTMHAVISDMNEPLGFAIGNSLEVIEAIDTLKGNGPQDLRDLCVEEAAALLQMSKICQTREEGMHLAADALDNGSAFRKFCELTQAQGGDVSYLHHPEKFARPAYITKIQAREAGKICAVRARAIGTLAMELGAGRRTKGDRIDPSVGIVLHRKSGDEVHAQETLAEIYSSRPLSSQWISRFYCAFDIR